MKYLFYVWIIFLILFGIYGIIQTPIINKKDFDLFYKSEINSRIIQVYARAGKTRIVLDDKRKFTFKPYTSQLNNFTIFSHKALPGDIVVKSAYSDTLVLKSANENFIYTFQRPDG